MSVPEVIVIAAFQRADLLRLHVLLATYESPYATRGEDAQRRKDETAHRELCHEVGRLLASVPAALGSEGGKL